MSLLHKLCNVVDDCAAEYEYKKNQPLLWQFAKRQELSPERHGRTDILQKPMTSGDGFPAEGGTSAQNLLAAGDNAAFMEWLLREQNMAGKLKLVYIDPPFFSNADYAAEVKVDTDKIKLAAVKQKAYRDTWENGMEEYLSMLAYRLFLIRELLAEDGGLWIHLDWHAVHYVKIIADEIFGQENFINEVVWTYKSGGVSKRRFARKHDTLLYYGKSKKYYFQAQREKSYNRGYKPYRFKGVKEYKDDLGWYTMVNKKDVWQIDMVGRTASERTGYATQKPEALLRQILESCTEEGDLCADFFCGSGTLPATAQQMGRRWIACDAGRLAVAETEKRLWNLGAGFTVWEGVPAMEAPSAAVSSRRSSYSEGVLEAKAFVAQAGISDRRILTVKLLNYVPPKGVYEMLDEKNARAVKRLIRKDSLCLVNFWCVEERPSEDGILRPKQIMVRNKSGLALQCESLGDSFGSGDGEILVRVWDLFGGCATARVKIENDNENTNNF